MEEVDGGDGSEFVLLVLILLHIVKSYEDKLQFRYLGERNLFCLCCKYLCHSGLFGS